MTKLNDNWRESAQPSPALTDEEACGQPAASFIPRWGMSFSCVLPKGHEGDHRKGGNCFKHGRYIGAQCPEWPDCIPTAAQPEAGEPRTIDELAQAEMADGLYDRSAKGLSQCPEFASDIAAKGAGALNTGPTTPTEPLTAEQFWPEYLSMGTDRRSLSSWMVDTVPKSILGEMFKFADALGAHNARQVRQGDAERIESLDWLIERYLGEISTLTAERDALLKALGCTLGGVPDALKVIEAKNDFIARAEAALREAREALKKYGCHLVVDGVSCCAAYDDRPCDCGFEVALKEKP